MIVFFLEIVVIIPLAHDDIFQVSGAIYKLRAYTKVTRLYQVELEGYTGSERSYEIYTYGIYSNT